MVRTLVVDPLIPGNLWVVLAVLSLAGVVAYLLVMPPRVSRARRVAIGVLLTIGVAGLLAVLLNPTWEELSRERIERLALGVLLDTSGSMETGDCGERTRLQAAKELAQELHEDLSDQFEVRLFAFDERLRPLAMADMESTQAGGIATDLGGSVAAALESYMGEEAGLVVLSDGIHNVPDSLAGVARAARVARAMGVPVFTKTLGTDASVQDLSVAPATPDDVAFVRQEVPIRALVEHRGIGRGSAEVTLHADDEVVGAQTVSWLDERPVRVEFPVRHDEPGIYRYVLRVSPLPQETVRVNNECVLHLRVTDTPINVLVLEGKPYWDLKFLLRCLAEDAGVSVTGAVRVADGRIILREFHEGEDGDQRHGTEEVQLLTDGSSLLGSYEALKHYHVVVLGRESQTFLTPANVENLCRWIAEWGGALVCARGQPVSTVPERLDAVMPVRWKSGKEMRFRMRISEQAEVSGWLPEGSGLMPSLATGSSVEAVKPLATVIARAESQEPIDDMAVVTCQPYGSGRVVVVEGSGLWRWALLTTDQENQRDLYRKFWNNLMRWLAASADFLPGETAALRSVRGTYTTLERPAVQLLVRSDPEVRADSAPLIELSNAAGDDVRRLSALPGSEEPGVFRASCDPLPQGAYVAKLVRTGAAHPVQCALEVKEPVAERLDLRARDGVMRRLAEESEGAVLTDDPAGQVREACVARWTERHPEEFRRTPVWDRLAVLLALAGVMVSAWVVRRRGGLV